MGDPTEATYNDPFVGEVVAFVAADDFQVFEYGSMNFKFITSI
jgi:hypothetical protein